MIKKSSFLSFTLLFSFISVKTSEPIGELTPTEKFCALGGLLAGCGLLAGLKPHCLPTPPAEAQLANEIVCRTFGCLLCGTGSACFFSPILSAQNSNPANQTLSIEKQPFNPKKTQ